MNPNPYQRAFFAKADADLKFVAERTHVSSAEVAAMKAAARNFSTRAAQCYAAIAASLRKDDETKVA